MPELSFSLAHSRCSLGYLLYFPPNNLPQSHFGLPRQNALADFAFDCFSFNFLSATLNFCYNYFMVDHLTKEMRSWNMSRIRSKNTKPEMIVRSLLHRMGYRFRLHRRDLPGKPDIVLPKYRTVVFVHGCFWHQHTECKESHVPKSNSDFWKSKLLRNVERDKRYQKNLAELGWRVLVVWECETENAATLEDMLSTKIQCSRL